MSNGNTNTAAGPDRAKGDSSAGVLVVAVTVLGTLVGVALLAAGAWACVRCGGVWHRRRKCGNKRTDTGTAIGFPPPQREMIEMGCLPRLHIRRPPYDHDHHNHHHHQHLHQQHPRRENNTGISKNLGLVSSLPKGGLPAVPSPGSWTPSPPYGPPDPQNTTAAAPHYYLRHHKDIAQGNFRGGNNSASKRERKGNSQHFVPANSFLYHPGYNSPASHERAARPAQSSSSSHRTLKHRRRPPDEANQRPFRKVDAARQRLRKHRRPTPYPKHLERRHRARMRCFPVDDHLANQYDCRGNMEQETDAPDACSSYKGSPHVQHPPASPLPPLCHPHHYDAAAPVTPHLEPFQAPVIIHSADCGHDYNSDHGTHIEEDDDRILPVDTLDASQEEEEEDASQLRLCPKSTMSMTSTNHNKPRRLWSEACGLTSKTLPGGPIWLNRLQAQQRKYRQDDTPLSSRRVRHTSPRAVSEAYEREVFRRIARKYGFCETCGVERSPKPIQECAQAGTQVAADGWDEFNAFSQDDPTPSMSWDNLSPDPSPALPDPDTQPRPPYITANNGGIAAAAAAAVSNNVNNDSNNNNNNNNKQATPLQVHETNDNNYDNDAGLGSGRLARARGSTYTILSCQSAE